MLSLWSHFKASLFSTSIIFFYFVSHSFRNQSSKLLWDNDFYEINFIGPKWFIFSSNLNEFPFIELSKTWQSLFLKAILLLQNRRDRYYWQYSSYLCWYRKLNFLFTRCQDREEHCFTHYMQSNYELHASDGCYDIELSTDIKGKIFLANFKPAEYNTANSKFNLFIYYQSRSKSLESRNQSSILPSPRSALKGCGECDDLIAFFRLFFQ